MEEKMKICNLKKVLCLFLVLALAVGIIPTFLVAGAETEDTETTGTDTDVINGSKAGTTTDSAGATITTEKELNATKITYSMTAGTNGTSGNFFIGSCYSKTETYYQGARNKGVIYRFPLVFSENLADIALTAQMGCGGLYQVHVSVDGETWIEVIGETTAAKVPTPADKPESNAVKIDEQTGLVNTVKQAVKIALGDGSAEYFYIRFMHPTDWNAPKVFGVDVSVRYYTVWSSTTETDNYGATATTVQKGTGYTSVTYEMTAGTEGTSDGYCVSKGAAGKATVDSYCGGKGFGGVIYQFPILDSDTLKSLSLATTVGNAYGIDVSLDKSNWIEIVPDTSNNGQKALSLDLNEAVKTALSEQSSDTFYIRYYHDSDWNAPKVYNLTVNAKYVKAFEFKAAALDVSLDGDIGLLFGVALDNAVLDSSNYRLEIVKSGETEAVKSVTLGSADAYEVVAGYQFIRLALAPTQMTEQYSIRLVNTETDEVFTDTEAHSVAEYAAKMIVYNPDAKALLVAMLNYGAYAQMYFDYLPDSLANVGYAYTNELESVIAPAATYTHTKGETVQATTYNVELEAKVKINVLFSNGELLTKEIVAKDLDEKQTFMVDDCVFQVSFMAYAGAVLSDETAPEALVNLLKAMILYNTAANAYFE